MNYSNTLKVGALVIILAVTISIKLIGLRADKPSGQKVTESIIALLARAGFTVEQKTLMDGVEIIGHAPTCRINVRDAFPQGYNLKAIAAWAPNDAQLQYAFRGQLFQEPPTYRATAAYVWTRTLRQFGLTNAWSPMLAIASTDACATAALPWGELVSE